MPLARIVTRVPESAASLADYLTRRGFTVEIAGPDEVYESSAELEITLETCAREQAEERAAQLASRLGADVVVAPGAIPARSSGVAEQAAEFHETVEGPPPVREPILARLPVVKETLGEWSRKGLAAAGATAHNFRTLLNDRSRKGSVLAKQWLKTCAQSARQLWVLAQLSAGKAVTAGRARIHEARVEAVARAHARLEMQARRRELARTQALSQPQAPQLTSAETAPSAAPINDHEEEATPIEMPRPVAPLRRPPPPRSSLVAYTRNRDWKMAFIGATAAALLIMVVSFEFMSALPPEHDVEQTQTLPIGAVTVQPSPPALINPATPPKPTLASPATLAEKAKPMVKVEPVTTMASQSEPGEEEYLDEEVVIRHYPAGDRVKARIGADGVKRISD